MKLVTWNIQWGRGVDGRVDLPRIVDEARRVADFDVLWLQEVSAGYADLAGCDGADQFEGLGALLPGYTPIVGVATDAPGPALSRRRFGNMLLSRLPVLQVFRHLLPWPADGTVATPLGLLRVATTHLEYDSARQRAAQVDRLRELHVEAVGQARAGRPGDVSNGPFASIDRGAAAVLTGDFNSRPGSVEHARMLLLMDDASMPAYLDAWQLACPGETHAPTVGVHGGRAVVRRAAQPRFRLCQRRLGATRARGPGRCGQRRLRPSAGASRTRLRRNAGASLRLRPTIRGAR